MLVKVSTLVQNYGKFCNLKQLPSWPNIKAFYVFLRF